MKYVLWAFLTLLGIYMVFCVMPAVVMYHKIFFRRCEVDRKKAYYVPYQAMLKEASRQLTSYPSEEVSITSHDGLTLRADYYDRGANKTAIGLHGYRATSMGNCAYQAAMLAEEGYNVLLVHQRGHAKSEGRYTTLGYKEQTDVLDWIDYTAQNPAVDHIVIYGVSMGAAAMALASDKVHEPKVRAMALDCGFFGIYEQLRGNSLQLHIPPWTVLPTVRLLFYWRFGYDIKQTVGEALSHTEIPALFIHGTKDHSVPLSHGEKNYRACASPKEMLCVSDAEHTCALLEGGAMAKKTLLDFFDKYIHMATHS